MTLLRRVGRARGPRPGAVGRSGGRDRHRPRSPRARPAAHLLGTDSLGRDILYRVLVATRLSVELAVIATAVGVAVGLVLGTAAVGAAAPGRPADHRRREHRGRVPGAAAGAVLRGRSSAWARRGAVLAIGVRDGAGLRPADPDARRVGGRAGLRLGGADRAASAGSGCCVRHILPNIGEPLIVNATIGAGGALLAFAGLSFLGIGVQAPRLRLGPAARRGPGRRSTSTRRPRSRPASAVVARRARVQPVRRDGRRGGRRAHARPRGRRPGRRRAGAGAAAAAEPGRANVGARRARTCRSRSRPGRVDRPGARGQLHACAAARRSASSASPARARA